MVCVKLAGRHDSIFDVDKILEFDNKKDCIKFLSEKYKIGIYDVLNEIKIVDDNLGDWRFGVACTGKITISGEFKGIIYYDTNKKQMINNLKQNLLGEVKIKRTRADKPHFFLPKPLCKARTKKDNRWTFGTLFEKIKPEAKAEEVRADDVEYFLIDADAAMIKIVPETLCFNTGFRDKENNQIFTRDAVVLLSDDLKVCFEGFVCYGEYEWVGDTKLTGFYIFVSCSGFEFNIPLCSDVAEKMKIAGQIFENCLRK